MAKEDEVRLIAYHIWEEEGCPNGRDCEHWYMAETVWEERQKPTTTEKAPAPPPARKPASTPTAAKRSSHPSAKRQTGS